MKKESTIFLMLAFSLSYIINFAFGQDPYELATIYGTKGSEDGEFNVPHSIAFDSKDNMYITDEENNKSTEIY